ncbi:hypothetical protein RJ55_03201 [Drechmeria coniospora]|nr:hypothetical protein RJ55_03201 [Drechmeria coniospora]
MTLTIDTGVDGVSITAEPLTPPAFAPFGAVISNPRPDVHPSSASSSSSLPPNGVSANQGTAIQYRNVSRARNLYADAPSGSAAPATSLFVCAARDTAVVTIGVLERHPFTTQTFSPLASSADTYLVVVAPSLPPSARDEALPVPRGDISGLPGRGLPDLGRLRAFVANGAQAVTYGAGTWHAPMIVLGRRGATLDFVVSQFASGVAVEDCQLVHMASENVKVSIPERSGIKSRL